jgi:hypothetical protein
MTIRAMWELLFNLVKKERHIAVSIKTLLLMGELKRTQIIKLF